jgi:hypothetical protein
MENSVLLLIYLGLHLSGKYIKEELANDILKEKIIDVF